MKVSIQRWEQVEISSEEALRVTIEKVLTVSKLRDRWIATRNGKRMVCEDEPPPHHGSIATVEVREATELDEAYYKVIKHLRRLVSED
jgi:hypothetical protein